MEAEAPVVASDVLPELVCPAVGGAPPLLDLHELSEMAMSVEVPLGTVDTDLRGLLGWKVGSIVRTDRQTGESLEITVNGTPIARGEVRVHGEWFAIRVTEILRASPDRDAEGAAPDVEASHP
jgi:flagellar motor switch protein FliN